MQQSYNRNDKANSTYSHPVCNNIYNITQVNELVKLNRK